MSTAIELAQQETAQETAATQDAVSMIESMVLVTHEDQVFAAEVLADIKAKHKALEKKRKAITTPLLAAKRGVDDLFRPVRERLEECERLIKGKIAGYLNTKQAENEAAMATVATAETVEEAQAALTTVEAVQAPEGVHVRHVWDIEITNEDLLDRMFLSPDTVRIKTWAAEHQDENGKPLAILGVKFVKRDIVVQRTIKS